jgi:hypothetical protein
MDAGDKPVPYKYEVGQTVRVLIKSREPFLTNIVELVAGKPFYRIDWAPGGFNPILNAVAIAEQAIQAVDIPCK